MAQRGSSGQASGQKQNTFFGGAAILAAGIFVVKIIGMFYKIPLVNIIGAQGNTDFTNAYNIYAVLLTISTAGLPVAVSKLVSEASATGRLGQTRRILRLSLALFLAMGVLSFLVMYFRADTLAAMMHDTKAAPGIRALAPAVICVGCLSAFRGYSQGHSNMAPTSISQIIEALCKLFVGLALAALIMKQTFTATDLLRYQPGLDTSRMSSAELAEAVSAAQTSQAAAGAITGVTVGTIVALAYMVLNYMFARAREPMLAPDVPEAHGEILKDILRIAIPITLSSSMVGIVTVIDSSLVQGQLQRVLLEKPECWALYTNFVDFSSLEGAVTAWKGTLPAGAAATMATLAKQVEQALDAQTAGTALSALDSAALSLHTLLESVSRTLYGNYGGSLNIYNLPTSLMAAITASVIPAVSGALAKRNRRAASRITGSALRVTALLAFPMGMGLFALGTPIMKLLYPALDARLAGPLLSTLGLATVFVCMMLVCNSVLQAHGFVNLPVLVMVAGGALKIFANYHVVAIPKIGIYGAPLGNILCFGLCLGLDLVLISRVIPRPPRLAPLFAKPLAASVLMGGCAWAVYGLVSKVFLSLGRRSLEAALSSGKAPGGLGALLCRLDVPSKQVLDLSRTGNMIDTLGAICVAVVLYAGLVIALRAISREDLSLMPKGDKIARLLHL